MPLPTPKPPNSAIPPWGETRYTFGTPTTDRKYTGQREKGDLGLYYYNARWYDPYMNLLW